MCRYKTVESGLFLIDLLIKKRSIIFKFFGFKLITNFREFISFENGSGDGCSQLLELLQLLPILRIGKYSKNSRKHYPFFPEAPQKFIRSSPVLVNVKRA